MSICVAVGNKVMDTRLPQPTGCGDKYDVSGLGLGRLLSTFCMFFKYPSPDAKASPSPAGGEGLHRPWCHKILGTDCASRPWMTGGRGANSFGRSMIEMLGVLAIIGVLSVGGIAGYSKAMEQFKINKATEEYVHLMYGLLEYLPDFQKNSKSSDDDNNRLVDFVMAAQLVPPTWTQLNNRSLLDAYGNNLNIFSRNNRLVVDLFLGAQTNPGGSGSYSINFPAKLCVQLFENLAIPLKESLYEAYYINNPGTAYVFYGDNYCSKGRDCLNTLSLSRVNELCSYCPADKNCGIIFEF